MYLVFPIEAYLISIFVLVGLMSLQIPVYMLTDFGSGLFVLAFFSFNFNSKLDWMKVFVLYEEVSPSVSIYRSLIDIVLGCLKSL